VSEPADDLAAAVLAVPGVARLNGGALGEIGTYLPGRRVPGIRWREAEELLDVHVVLRHDADVRGVAEQIHRVVAQMSIDLSGTPRTTPLITVHVDDLE